MGFCLLNNVAIAARAAQADGIERVAIVDFDVHHGNGTQAIFYSDPDVLYVSTHQVGIYPGTGAIDELGAGKGIGATVNLPFPALAGDRAFQSAMERVISPALSRHQPDLILVSAGFDAHWRDPLANLRVTPVGFHDISQRLTRIAIDLGAAGPVFCLEGGYEPEALAHSVSNALCGILDQPCSTEPWTPPDAQEPDIEGLLDQVVDVHGL
jgi:acetoin utilization deacetylase AcuC-like enzyme